ncbi:cyclase family protein [Carboxylicivirga mesophila]|uniref:Cyclase family protein n=1 Tax=Carboxylicivirga mesophila TaxID=1166478 RepID=A0ABS5KCC8_9BACT|nr:cyclase family protein [Carboxylicivirga mesophila]MBS2212650.1 cyclase family protein [Carboxylicivirga mesophila]
MRIVDLSKPIRYNKEDPWFMRVIIKHKPHRKSKWLIRFLGLPFKLFPKDFIGWADDTIKKMGVHSTTHIDAPWHYAPSANGKKSMTVDEIPLEWCYGEGLMIDMSYKEDFDPITVSDIESFLAQEHLNIRPGMIVLIKTGRDKYNGTKNFHKIGTGMSAEATEWLIDKGIKVMGIDAWGWDLPLPYMLKKARETKDSELFWEGHLVGRNKAYCHMEQLVNLGNLPYCGFKIAVFPLKIVGASAAPARVVAIFE